MKIIIIAIALFVAPSFTHAATDYYLKLDGVKGETEMAVTGASAPARATTTGTSAADIEVKVTPPIDPQKASVDMFLEIEGVKGESKDDPKKGSAAPSETVIDGGTIKGETAKKGGNVEFEWKVEEGESGPVRPAIGDITGDGQSLTPDFSILFGGGDDDDCEDGGKDGCGDDRCAKGDNDCDDSDKDGYPNSDNSQRAGGAEHSKDVFVNNADPAAARAAIAELLLKGAQEAGAPIESLSLNFTKIEMKARQDAKLFGIIPFVVKATVEIDADSRVKVKFPWWSFLVSGTDPDTLGQTISNSVSNVLKTKHDTVKNSIGNIR